MTTSPANNTSARSIRVLVALIGAMLVAFVALVGFTLVRANEGTTYRYVIPEGASTKFASVQEIPGGPPQALSLRLGDTLVIQNDDVVAHTYGFLVLEPGEVGRHTFKTKGTFQGECTFGAHKEVVITVT